MNFTVNVGRWLDKVIRDPGCVKLAGMDGNRTHPGRLSSAPQTVLKTAWVACATVHLRPHQFSHEGRQSLIVRIRPRSSAR